MISRTVVLFALVAGCGGSVSPGGGPITPTPGGDPTAAELAANPFLEKRAMTLQLKLIDTTSRAGISLTMRPRTSDTDPWIFEATSTDPATGLETVRVFDVPAPDLASLNVVDLGNGNLTVRNPDGSETGWRGTYTTAVGPGPDEVTITGSITNGTKTIKYTGVTDPAPVAIIVAIGVGAAICAIIVAVEDCPNSVALKASIDACRENGGKPQVTITTTFGIRFNPFNVGCGTDCDFKCL